GLYTVTVALNSLDQDNFTLVNDTLSVTMKKATITVSATKTANYNASNQEIKLSFSPISLVKDRDYKVTYQGNLTNGLPLNAGDYQVNVELMGSIAENYTLSGEADTVFKISPARISVGASGTYTYTGEVQSVRPRFANSVNPAILPTKNATIHYSIQGKEVEFLNAGIYTITIELAAEDKNNFTLSNATLSIEMHKAKIVTVEWTPAVDTMVYNGVVQNVAATGVWGDNQSIPLEVQVAGGKEILNAGDYILVASLNDTNFEAIEDTKELHISQATIQLNIRNNNTKYTGTKQSATIGFIEKLYPTKENYTVVYSLDDYYDQEGAIDAGKYQLTVTLPESGNFKFRNGYTASASYTITPIELHAEINSVIYNGQPQNADILLKLDGKPFTTRVDYIVEYQGENLVDGLPKNVGSYTAIIHSEENRNYSIVQDSNQTFEIQKATVTAQIPGAYTYTGAKQDVEVIFANALNSNVIPTNYEIHYMKDTCLVNTSDAAEE
ncbi:MAG: MBG domain-containing protein, partial [Anaeroplasmataceae bacterium]|nr:MBG domain-containing protein [Anaeroplasmataceae bacterium]